MAARYILWLIVTQLLLRRDYELGRCVVHLSIGNLYLKHEVVVAAVAAEGLLGSDFMMKHDMLDFQKHSMVIDGEKVNIRE